MKVVDFLKPELVIGDIKATAKSDVLLEMTAQVARVEPRVNPGILRRVLEERELLASTAIGDGIAIPHGKVDTIAEMIGALGRSVGGLEFDSLDGKPTHLVFLLVAPATSTGIHLKALARLSRLFRVAQFRERLMEAPDAAAMYRIIQDEDAKY